MQNIQHWRFEQTTSLDGAGPRQCVHYSQFVVQILYAASFCCCLLNKLAAFQEILSRINKPNKMQLQMFSSTKWRLWEWMFNPLTIQGRQVKVGQPGLVMWDLAPLCTVQVYNHTHVKNYDLVRTSVPCDVWTHTGMKKVNYHNTADLTNFAVHKPNPLTADSCVTRFRIPLTSHKCV